MLTQTTRRERILVYGTQKLGKSTCWFDIADTYYQTASGHAQLTGDGLPHFYVIDTDFGTDKMLDEGFQHIEDAGMLTVFNPRTFEDLQRAGKKIERRAKRGDWIVIDMMHYAWSAAQDYYSIHVYGQDPVDYMIEMRKQVVANKHDGRSFGGHDGTNWNFISKIYKAWEFPLTTFTVANVFGVTSETKLDPNRGAPTSEIKRYKHVGSMKPEGQKGIGHRMDTVLRMTQRANGQRQLTMAGERGIKRGKVWDDRGSLVLNVNDAPHGFTEAYLIDVAGWTMGGDEGRRNDSKSSKKKRKKNTTGRRKP